MANLKELEQQQEERPPFAMVGAHSPQHLFSESTNSRIESGAPVSPNNVSSKTTKHKKFLSDSQISSNSTSQQVPGLVESIMSEGSSSSVCDSDHQHHHSMSSSLINKSPPGALLAWSLRTVSSDVGGSSLLPVKEGDLFHFGGPQHNQQQHQQQQIQPVGGASCGFSQLLRAADDANIQLGHSRMPVVPEDQIVGGGSGELMESGTIIASPTPINHANTEQQTAGNNDGWFPNFLSGRRTDNASTEQQQAMREPLLAAPNAVPDPTTVRTNNQSASILHMSPYERSLAQAKTTITSVLENDTSFEVSMDITSDLTVQDVMNVLGNPDLLKLWCDPIQSLIVTSSTDATRDSPNTRQPEADRGREYEGEWIEATTTALESPPSAVGFLFGAGQSVLQSLGFASYGKITMFVERRRGQVGLTVGPFQGGIHAAHTINVFEENGAVRIVDRVRLSHDEHETTLAGMFLCGAFGACLDSCLLPPLGSYMEQVKTSMGRLRLLVDNERRAPGGAIITGGTLISVPVQ